MVPRPSHFVHSGIVVPSGKEIEKLAKAARPCYQWLWRGDMAIGARKSPPRGRAAMPVSKRLLEMSRLESKAYPSFCRDRSGVGVRFWAGGDGQ